MRIAQAHEAGRQERGRRNFAGPVQREGIHRFQHAVLDAVDQLEIADDFLGRERLEFEFATGLVLDRAAPLLEGVEADASRPRRLHLPCRSFRSFSVADIRRRNRGAGYRAGTRFQQMTTCGVCISELVCLA